ncbi:uncharacterized protein BO97DRAFT_439177 [Aspergillus homomorphus CBS 101889]|uniref:Uncharacterized protein n=1 Tax=Aspergillus homomorphus (strain CBS 101889) TaxID=1450537 RepID=A0A395IG85_ASPHC|nr:hypothetical protein BO97DRAFT_439177 [Aspergillus homomorphus CBS 101889]RAL17204.1 hypothetical protein BO97DRAFT_439177 [Aspergillus homomorphus CBS 101889]
MDSDSERDFAIVEHSLVVGPSTPSTPSAHSTPMIPMVPMIEEDTRSVHWCDVLRAMFPPSEGYIVISVAVSLAANEHYDRVSVHYGGGDEESILYADAESMLVFTLVVDRPAEPEALPLEAQQQEAQPAAPPPDRSLDMLERFLGEHRPAVESLHLPCFGATLVGVAMQFYHWDRNQARLVRSQLDSLEGGLLRDGIRGEGTMGLVEQEFAARAMLYHALHGESRILILLIWWHRRVSAGLALQRGIEAMGARANSFLDMDLDDFFKEEDRKMAEYEREVAEEERKMAERAREEEEEREREKAEREKEEKEKAETEKKEKEEREKAEKEKAEQETLKKIHSRARSALNIIFHIFIFTYLIFQFRRHNPSTPVKETVSTGPTRTSFLSCL